jgi:23S rRNA (guanine745-N1)-methyltransferase
VDNGKRSLLCESGYLLQGSGDFDFLKIAARQKITNHFAAAKIAFPGMCHKNNLSLKTNMTGFCWCLVFNERNIMLNFCCPVCKKPLILQDGSYFCENNHCFDLARAGYVNLLQSQKSSKKRHGDDKLMVAARTDFLNKGYYKCLADGMIKAAKKYAPTAKNIIDVGCGDGYYTEQIFKAFDNCSVSGIDISKYALAAAAKRKFPISLAVASASKLPYEDNCCDLMINMFAPIYDKEFSRVLKDSGVLIRAVVGKRHLFGLKSAIYDNPYENPCENYEINGLILVDKIEIADIIKVDGANSIESLFKMTPYYYKTSAADQQKIKLLSKLTTEIEFLILVYKGE